MKQHEVAEMVGKDRTTVANSLRLLNLPPSVRDMVREGSLTIGHAKALLALEKHETILALAKEIVARHLTVRDVERRIKTKRSMKSGPEHGRSVSARAVTAQLKAAESLIRKRLQTDIELVRKDDGAGVISIRFYSDEDFERVLDLMGITLQ
jgi:ParB family chromosome partitioning protein